MRFTLVLLIVSLPLTGVLSADEAVEKKLKAAGLVAEVAEKIAATLPLGYSEVDRYLKKADVAAEDPVLVGVWKWILARRIDDETSLTAFWLVYKNLDRNEWLRLLGHPSPPIVSQAIDQVVKNNDVDAVPALIGLLYRTDKTGAARSSTIQRDATLALLKLTHHFSHLPKWGDAQDERAAREARQQWYTQNAGKSQAEWRKTGDAQILKLLESDNIEDAFRGFMIAKRLGIRNDKKFDALLNKFSGQLQAKLVKNPKGGYLYAITNTGKDAIVAFKRNCYLIKLKPSVVGSVGSARALSSSPYLAAWEYAMILKKGQSWQIKLSADKEILSCKVTELLRGSSYQAAVE